MMRLRRRGAIADRGLGYRLGLLLAGVLLIYAYGVTGYMMLGFGFIDAAYMTALALTTAGFNPVQELTPGEKSFTISIAVFGATLFLMILAVVTSVITEGRLGMRARRRRMEREIERLRDHFIVCAYGRVGRSAAREFEGEGVPFVVVDTKEELEESMQRDGVLYVIADPSSEAVLRRVGIERARGLICAVDSDASNVYITLVARSINPNIFIAARAAEPETPERLYRAGADRVISPYVASGRHMARLSLHPRVVDYVDVAAGDDRKVRLEEVLVEPGSPLEGVTLREAKGEAVAVLVRRASGEMIPNPPQEQRLAAGDLVVFAGEPASLRSVED